MDQSFKNDQKVINEGRKERLEGVEAPLRDQIVQKLYNKLDDMNIGQYVVDQWNGGNAHRAAWLERQQEYLLQWDDHLVRDTDGSFSGWSQLHIPITFIVCKALHARYLQALWQEPPFNCKARKESSLERVPVVRDTMNYYLTRGANYGKGVGKVVDQWLWKWISAGSGMLKERWDVTYSKFVDVQPVQKAGPPQLVLIDGQEQLVPTVVEAEEEVEVIEKCFDGPVAESVDAEDLLIIGGGGDPDLADEVHHRSWMTASQLWTLVDRKVFKEDAVKEIIQGGRNYKGGAVGNDIKDQKALNAGQASVDSETEHDRYEIIESHMKLDVDGSGIGSDVVTWVHPKSRQLCNATYLRRIYKSGERPFIKADFHLRDGQEYGIGIPELMYPIQKEIDALHNMRVDWGMISTMPFFFYKATSSLDPKTIQFEPGMGIPVDDPQRDIYFPQLGNRTIFGFQEEQALDTLIQRLTGINDIALGMLSSQGATRTATGSRLVNAEMSSNLDVHLKRLNWGWDKFLRFMLSMVQHRMPKGLSYRVTGDDGQDYWRNVESAALLEGDFDIEISSNSASSNEGIQQERAAEILQLTGNPFDYQVGVFTVANRYEAVKNYLQSKKVKDWGRFVTKPEGYERPLSPVEEADRLLIGQEVKIQPNMDHEGFINLVEMFKKDDLLNGQFQPQQIALLEAQAIRHAEMVKALQQMAAQQANANQMRVNASMSQQQAPVGLNPQAGAGG